MNKAWSTYLALVAILMSPIAAQADVVQNLHLQFASGATFNGTVTFADGFDGLLDVSGTLTGGGYRDTDFTWTYLEGSNYTNPLDWDGNSRTWEDFLMNGRPGYYTAYIGLSWFRGFDPVLNLNTIINFRALNDRDPIVRGRFSSVPEPGTLALFSLGLLGIGAAKRRKAAA